MSATPRELLPESVWAVVVNWNGGEGNLECLKSLVEQGIDEERIVFVDNASLDGSRERVQQDFPGLEVIENDTNLGFGEGANLGARRALEAGARAVFFINNDLVLEGEVLGPLCELLTSDERIGFTGPRVLQREERSKVWCAGGELSWRQNLSTLIGHGKDDGAEFQSTREVDYIPGCSLLARREVLEEVGLFDARYFAYTEDVDLCLRAQKAGWKVVLLGATTALHASSSATGGGYNPRRKYMMGVNSIWFLREHAGWSQWLRFWFFDVLSLPFVWLAALPKGRGKAVCAKAAGIWAGLRGERISAATLQRNSWLW